MWERGEELERVLVDVTGTGKTVPSCREEQFEKKLCKRRLNSLTVTVKVFEKKFGQVVEESQSCSQSLSSLPPLVVGRKTLVAAGHVTTQNLGGKKTCWVGGVVEYFVCCSDKLWVSNPLAVAKNCSLYQRSKSNLPMKNAT